MPGDLVPYPLYVNNNNIELVCVEDSFICHISINHTEQSHHIYEVIKSTLFDHTLREIGIYLKRLKMLARLNSTEQLAFMVIDILVRQLGDRFIIFFRIYTFPNYEDRSWILFRS